jgi:hypothetical protein
MLLKKDFELEKNKKKYCQALKFKMAAEFKMVAKPFYSI